MEGTPQSYDVIVVGSGLAGLAAAIEAADAGVSVALLEKESRNGGNSAKASSGMNSVGSEAQKSFHIDDSIDKFIADTLRSGEYLSNTALVDILAKQSKDALEFLIREGRNETLRMDDVIICGGHSVARTHRSKPDPSGKPGPNVGWEIVSTLLKRVKERPGVHVLSGVKVVDLIVTEADGVVGVMYHLLNESGSGGGELHRLFGRAVILATGGYSADRKGFLAEYAPRISDLPTTNGPFALGEGIKMALRIGAEAIDLDKVQVHPTAFVDPKEPLAGTQFLAPEAFRGAGGILLNVKGERFVNELGRRKDVVDAIMYQQVEGSPMAFAYLVLNSAARDRHGAGTLSFYESKGFFQSYENVAAFANAINIVPEMLQRTLLEYGRLDSDPYGKTVFPTLFSPPDEKLWVAKITPAIHYCMGGLRISENTEVLLKGELRKPIKGLYAAGEVSGGVHGSNRLAGNSLLECTVFGRIAGLQAAAYVHSTTSPKAAL